MRFPEELPELVAYEIVQRLEFEEIRVRRIENRAETRAVKQIRQTMRPRGPLMTFVAVSSSVAGVSGLTLLRGREAMDGFSGM